jgi:hypothetical protein
LLRPLSRRHSLLAPTCTIEVSVGGRKGQEGTEVAKSDHNLEAHGGSMVGQRGEGIGQVDDGG